MQPGTVEQTAISYRCVKGDDVCSVHECQRRALWERDQPRSDPGKRYNRAPGVLFGC